MTRKKHVVNLSEDERAELESFVSSGIHRAEDITRARVLLKADDGATDAEWSAQSMDTHSAYCLHKGCRRFDVIEHLSETELDMLINEAQKTDKAEYEC